MFDIGWPELLVLAVIAVLVVGPKDLPRLMATIGRHVGQLRKMAADFQRSLNDMAREAELDELKREIDSVGKGEILSAPPPLRDDEAGPAKGSPSVGDGTR